MGKKITVISVIKNSADIIETFIRANGVFADNFVLVNNGSTDRTMEILEALSKEGYNIQVYNDPDTAHVQSMRMNILVRKIYQTDNPDWVIPLDDDEILFAPGEGAVRSVLESLDDSKLYYVKWRIYVPNDGENDDRISAPFKQTRCFSDSHKTYNKVILSRHILRDYDTLIAQGNHDVVNCGAEPAFLEDLMIAHYPVRSVGQITAKAFVGWTNTLAINNNPDGNGGHWKTMYDLLKAGGKITIDMMWGMCALYIMDLDEKESEIVENPINIQDERAFLIKYTNEHEVNPWINYMNNTEQLAENYRRLKERV